MGRTGRINVCYFSAIELLVRRKTLHCQLQSCSAPGWQASTAAAMVVVQCGLLLAQ